MPCSLYKTVNDPFTADLQERERDVLLAGVARVVQRRRTPLRAASAGYDPLAATVQVTSLLPLPCDVCVRNGHPTRGSAKLIFDGRVAARRLDGEIGPISLFQ